jgi:phytoene synthase
MALSPQPADMSRSDMLAALREADIDRYLSLLLMPDGVRNDLLALFLFNAEIASIRDRIREALPGEVRLQWWRDVLSGKGTARRRRIRSLPPLLR